ncbi:MAG: hypothetical protein R3E90_05940 [Marinicella sp.]
MNKTMKSIHVQKLLSFIFFILGGWCLVMPGTVELLSLKPEYYVGNATSRLLLGCFGAQAILVGAVILFSEFKPKTFLVFGIIGSVPFFVFNFYFYFIAKMFTDWMLLDFIGNLGILGLGIWGFRLSKQEM